MTRYDITARVPSETSPDNLKLMLQSLLAERFGLKAHTETKPLPTYALTLGKKPNLKESHESGETGCRPQAGPPPSASGGPGGGTIIFSTAANSTPRPSAVGVYRDHAFRLQLAERYVNRPTVGTYMEEAIIGEFSTFTDAHTGVTQ